MTCYEVKGPDTKVLIGHSDLENFLFKLQRKFNLQLVPIEITLKSDGESWVSIPGKMRHKNLPIQFFLER
ncbi:MAG: hypothetical protein CMI18_03670 [Opitutaceae bacterium]|nr:hypothetical protein [Opitutaceae bacterium]